VFLSQSKNTYLVAEAFNMSIHISAKPGEIAPLVLLPGDPLRAKFIANELLTNPRLVSETRNCLFYTGYYKNKQISVGASGMGCPSIGIYSYELYTEYQVDTIIRIGTCGAYDPGLRLFDLINVKEAVSESTFALHAWGIHDSVIECQGDVYNTINTVAAQKGWPLHCGCFLLEPRGILATGHPAQLPSGRNGVFCPFCQCQTLWQKCSMLTHRIGPDRCKTKDQPR
jgi:purine-nucleoside phosphorylase